MFKAVSLSLWIGPGAPVPAPQSVLDALESLQVTSGIERSAFQLTFRTGKASPLVTTMLPLGYFDPIITRVIAVATIMGIPHVLMDGVVTQQDVAPSSEPGESSITITGEDLSVLMDLVEMPFMRYPAQPVVARVYTMLAKYAGFGIAPIAIPPVLPDSPNFLEEVPTHHGTDLAYIKDLARQCGYVLRRARSCTRYEHGLLWT
jgi:hypothetical protein